MVASGLSRSTINKNIFRIKRLFAWGVEQEIVDVRIHQTLKTVRSLAKGRTNAPERPAVRPVTVEQVEAIMPHLSPTLKAMVQLQRLTGARPSEVCLVRPCDVDTSGAIWCYRPASHKTEHHDQDRRVFLGPRAQEVLRPFLERPVDAYCFSPRESRPKEETPRRNRRRKQKSARPPGVRYSRDSYRRAIARACEIAFSMPKELRVIAKNASAEEKPRLEAEAAKWRREHCWCPNRLRHLRATEIREKFGLEASQTVLGHSRANVTEHYAERDFAHG